MPGKPITEDIVVPNRKSRLPGRDITISLSAKKKEPAAPPRAPAPKPPRKAPPKKLLLIAGGVALFLVLLTGVALLTGGVEVAVAARTKTFSFTDTFSALPADSEDAAKGLSYVVHAFSRTAEELVPATERKHVEERARGRIIIFNDYSTETQRLIKNTRFETPEGLIFRIAESVVVPGQKVVDGKKTPGSLEVDVFSDEPDPKYNIGLTDFTVPGFKGTPRYDKFFGRSKTPMTGGFSGDRLQADPAAIEAAKEKLKQTLAGDLATAVENEAPPETVHLTKTDIVYEETGVTETEGGVKVGMRGTLKAAFVRETALAAAIAEKALPDYDGYTVYFLPPKQYTITATPAENDDAADITGPLGIAIDGTISLMWKFDSEALKKDLAGRKSSEMNQIMSDRHPGIQNAKAKFRPFCIRCIFPKDPANIEVTTATPGEPAI